MIDGEYKIKEQEYRKRCIFLIIDREMDEMHKVGNVMKKRLKKFVRKNLKTYRKIYVICY